MKKTRQDSTAIRNWTNRTFPFGIRLRTFTAERRLWPRKPSGRSGKATFGAPDCPSTSGRSLATGCSRLQRQATIYDHINSISHLEDFVKAALDLWEIRAPFGIYNVTNPGAITTRELVEGLQRVLKPPWGFKIGLPEDDPARAPSATPQSHCILDAAKLLKTGVKLRPVSEAVKDCLDRLRLASRSLKGAAAIAWACLAGCLSFKLWN